MDQQISKDPRSISCPSFVARPEATHGHHQAYDMMPPEAPPDYYYYPYSSNNSSSNSSSSSTAVADESLSSVATKINTVNGQSDWLRRRRRTSAYGRAILGIIGMIVFLLIITGMVVWIGNAFILPQVKYTTRYPQSTRSLSTVAARPTKT